MSTIQEQREKAREARVVRDAAICKMYMEGATLEECGRRHKVTRMRVKQIVKKAGAWRPRAVQDRGTHLGVKVNDEVKEALRTEAERRGISMSSLTNEMIADKLAGLSKEEAS